MRKVKCEQCGHQTELNAEHLALMATDETAELNCSHCGQLLQAKYHGKAGALLVAAVGVAVNLQARGPAGPIERGQSLQAVPVVNLEGQGEQ